VELAMAEYIDEEQQVSTDNGSRLFFFHGQMRAVSTISRSREHHLGSVDDVDNWRAELHVTFATWTFLRLSIRS
jgi:hypothetical protein